LAQAAKERKMTDKQETVIAYKGFDKDLKCRGYQFKVGETFTHEGAVKACESGFHACENPLDVLSYYDLCDSRFAIVEMSGEYSRHADDSKIASAKISIKAKLSLPQFIGYAIDWVKQACNIEKPDFSGDKVQAASGDSSQLAASGDSSQLAASGDSSKLAASGDSSKIAASGRSSIAIASAAGCIAKAGELGCIALTRWVEAEKRYRLSVAYVGENDIKADTFYKLDGQGNFVEVLA
jgi:hypothetical protein